MEGTNLDCEQFKCCKLPHIKVWSQTKYARSHVSPTLISVRDLLQTDPAVAAHQESLRAAVKDKLALFMIRRDENSRIRDKPVMIDYFKRCTVFEEPLVPSDNGKEAALR